MQTICLRWLNFFITPTDKSDMDCCSNRKQGEPMNICTNGRYRSVAGLLLAGGLSLAGGLLPAAAALADEITSTPITSASVDSKKADTTWGPGGALIPEAEWRPYVGRKSAFGGGMSSGLDSARMPVLSGGKSGGRGGKTGGTRASGGKKSSAPKVAVVKPDPCAEKVRVALEEAARTGKIPASAVPAAVMPPAGGTDAPAVPGGGTRQVSPTSQAVPQTAPSTAQAAPTPAPEPAPAASASSTTYPYSAATSSVAPAGTSAQGTVAPPPPAVRQNPPPFSVD